MAENALKILEYPHPILRHVSKPVRRIDAELKRLVREMFDLMYAARGIGLAGNQVGLPYRLFVANLTAHPGQPGEERVFINPVLRRPKGSAEAEEGCLSLPGVYRPVVRPASVHLQAYDLEGQPVSALLDDLWARMVQHETDHLDGVLFIDRLSDTDRLDIREDLREFEINFESRRHTGEIPDDETIRRRIAELEQQRT